MKLIPKISIITVVANDEKNIEKTIESVINQDYRDYEYIIIDGYSTDQTKQVVKNYLHKIDCFLSEPDSGIYDAMNKGLKLSNGEFIYFLNSGDCFVDRNTLSVVADFLDEDIIFFKVLKVYEKFSKVMKNSFKLLKFGCMPPHQGMFVKKNVFSKEGFFSLNYKSSADFEMLCRISKKYKYRKVNLIVAHMPCGGMSSNKEISYSETREIISDYFGTSWSLLFYVVKNIEQVVKKILLFFHIDRIYKRLA